ncbi:MAG TPA: two-component regulator propeller domain-containing protein [Bacteroidia bacterium]|nr:two-component regulator propeller domain-containing protein [Bacteroidia bacterium]
MTLRYFKHYNFIVCIFILLSFAIPAAKAQQIKNISSINNQRNISFNCLVQANDGTIWYGTNNGVIKFDGEKFKNFENTKGLINVPVSAIFIDQSNLIWIGHNNGKITIFENEKFSAFPFNDQLGSAKITSFIENNGMWIGTYGNGVYHVDKKNKVNHYNDQNGLSDNAVYTMCIDKRKSLWVGTDGGLTCLKNKKNATELDIISMKKGLPDNIVRNIILAQNGDLIIAMQDSGICAYNVDQRTFKKNEHWNYGPVISIIEFEPNTFYIASEKNAIFKCVISNDKIGSFSRLNYTENVDCRDLNVFYKDREKNLWFLKKNGMSILSQSRWKIFQKNNGIISDTILSVLIDSKNNCWIGSNKGLHIYSIPSYYEIVPTELTVKQQIYDKEVTCIFEDKFGNIWFGTYGNGLFKYNTKTKKIKSIPLQTEFENDNVSCITVDDNNKIWVSTLGGGISMIDNINASEEVKNFSFKDGLGVNYVYSILCDSQNLRWVGTDGIGLLEYTAGIFIKVNEKSNLESKSVYSIAKSSSGNVWFNMSEHGLYKFDGNSLLNYSTLNGLTDNNPLSISTYKNLVMAIHNNGIDVFNEKSNQFTNFYLNDVVFEPNLNASFTDKKGNVWIGTNNGLFLFNSSDIYTDTITPIASFTSVLVNNVNVNFDSKNSFSSSQNSFLFNFNAVWFKIGEKVKFKYMLKGVDKKFIYSENKSISYGGLQAGSYTFYLSASNGEGHWSKPITYHFTIAKPMWQIWWVWILAIAIIYLSIHLILRYRLNLLKREKKILEHKVQLRTQEIVNQSKIIEAKNKDITDSIEYAKKIQDSILPNIEYIKNFLPHSFIFYKQKDIVSGDFYWFAVKNNHIIFAAVDCTGHGVPGAFMSLIGNNVLNQIVNENNVTDPATILMQLNTGVLKALYGSKNYSTTKDGMDIGICNINIQTKNLIFAGAMRPLYLCREGVLEEILGDKVSIGTDFNEGTHKNFSFSNKEIKIQDNDVFYLSTDGYADQFGGEKGKKMMKKNFKNLLQLISNRTMDEQAKVVSDSLIEWKGNFEQVDDILVIGFKLS